MNANRNGNRFTIYFQGDTTLFTRHSLILVLVTLLLLLAAPTAQAQKKDPTWIESVLSLTAEPTPLIAGEPVTIRWDADIAAVGAVSFTVYIPQDWYDEGEWQSGTGVLVTTHSGAAYTPALCLGLEISGVQTHCVTYTANNVGATVESLELMFTLSPGATADSGRPVRVVHTLGVAGSPAEQTISTTVDPVPDVRYVANDVASCGAYSPCDHGPDAMRDAVQALPASGGTVRVVGVHETRGVVVSGKDVTFEPAGAAATIASSNTGSGCHTTFDSLIEVQDGAAVTIRNLTLIGETDSDCGDYGVQIGCAGCSSNLWVEGSTFSDFPSYGIVTSVGASGTIQNSRFLENQHGISVGNASNFTIRGNQFENNLVYGVIQLAANSTLAMYANNFSGNNTGNFQAAVRHLSAAAKNWWGSYSDPLVGPHLTGDYNSYTEGWNHRLGAPVKEWAAGEDNVVLGDAALNGSGRGVIISFGRGTANAPFGNGIPPYANRTCSDYYDFYALDNPSDWTVSLPIDNSTACNNMVLTNEIAYTIDPAVYDTACATANNTGCWEPVDPANITANGSSLEITGLDLSHTHVAAGDQEGLDPTAITQLRAEASGVAGAAVPLVLVVMALLLLAGVSVRAALAHR